MKKIKRPKPFPYQREGVRRGWVKFKGRYLCADEMGLGKTPQALWGHVWHNDRKGPMVVVCPAYLKYNWENEVKKYTGLRAYVCEGEIPPPDVPKCPVYIINYDILTPKKRKRRRRGIDSRRTWVKVLRAFKPSLIVPDEVQMVKEMDSGRTKALRRLQRGAPYLVALGGTAGLENCPAELFPILNMINPKRWANFYPYAHRYCQPKPTPWGTTYKGATNLDELHALLKKTCMVRRLKKDVLTDLPLRRSNVVQVDITNRKEYEAAEKDLIKWLVKFSLKKAKAAARNEKLVKWAYLKRLTGQGKFKAIVEWVRDFLTSGEKLILFGVHTDLLTWVYEAFKKDTGCVLVTGKVPAKQRQLMFDRFNTDPRCRLLVGNIEAAGTGWSCRSASTVAFCELAWTPSKHRQAGDRVHGLNRGVEGRRSRTVYLIAHGTVEEKMSEGLQKKQKIQDQLLDGKRRSGKDLDLRDMLEKQLMKKAYR
jgi:SWI/SNF-related matrix-associated actin-dependent regulator 1 of chromatin subfamily A